MDLLTLGYIVASLAILVELLILAILIKRLKADKQKPVKVNQPSNKDGFFAMTGIQNIKKGIYGIIYVYRKEGVA